jgi:nickel superoxide dismutase|tara:strand:- start:384 stop:875 length:492 start_codon:yes stop_codon:yes gene_type:complete
MGGLPKNLRKYVMIKYFNRQCILVTLLIAMSSSQLKAHCQVPCGIYDDYARIKSMIEDSETINKAMIEMVELSNKNDLQSKNQSVRWIMNKEKHAQNIIDTISDYFLTQRVKTNQEDYSLRLINHHKVIIAAMKSKQSVDIKYVDELRNSIKDLSNYYPEHSH